MSVRELIPESYTDQFFEYLDRWDVAGLFIAVLVLAPVLFSVPFSGYYVKLPTWLASYLPDILATVISITIGIISKIFWVLLTACALFSLIGFAWVRFKSIGISTWEESMEGTIGEMEESAKAIEESIEKLIKGTEDRTEAMEQSMEKIEESIRNTVAESLGPYGEVSRIRGRDIFGPIVDEPAEKITVTLSLQDVNDREFEYSLEYEINFGRKLSSSLPLETFVLPVYKSNYEHYKCYKYETPEPHCFTIDFNPVVGPKDILLEEEESKLSEIG